MASDSKKEPPAGYHPLGVNNKQMDTYGLKTGPGRKDTLTHKLFNKVRRAALRREALLAGRRRSTTRFPPPPRLRLPD